MNTESLPSHALFMFACQSFLLLFFLFTLTSTSAGEAVSSVVDALSTTDALEACSTGCNTPNLAEPCAQQEDMTYLANHTGAYFTNHDVGVAIPS